MSRPSPSSLMPWSQAPLNTLMTAMTVMCYLACLAIGALILVTRAVDDWSSEIAGEVTVQIRPVDNVKMTDQIAAASGVLRASRGVLSVNVLDKSAGSQLLEPWLGNADILDELPIPRLISVAIDQEKPPDFEAIEKALKSEVPGARLDTHRRWQAELVGMGSTLKWLGYAVLLLITASAFVLVVFASRSALDANRQVVEVLHLVGATNPFIARQVQWQFLRAGIKAGLLGTFAGMATFVLIGYSNTTPASSGLAEASYSLLIGKPEVTGFSYLLFLLVPLITTLICLIAARLAILRILKNAI